MQAEAQYQVVQHQTLRALEHHEMLVGQPPGADAPQRGQRMAGGQRDHQRFLEQCLARKLGVGDGRADEADVDVAPPQGGRLLRQRKFTQFEPHSGMGGSE
jgi:hypothetical protein